MKFIMMSEIYTIVLKFTPRDVIIRYYVDTNWTLKKIDNPVNVPEELDLTPLLRPSAADRSPEGLQVRTR
jgi:hypothetical protein